MKSTPTKTAVAPPPAPARRAFTLIELLVVISIIGVLAGLTLGVVVGVVKNKYISTARAEMASIQAGIENYHSVYGVYPPSNPNYTLVNPLYFELVGTTSVVAPPTTNLTSLDGAHFVDVTKVLASLGVSGFINATRGSGDDKVPAKTFLANLKANQVGTVTNPAGSGNPAVAILITSVGGPDQAYQPLGGPALNPWRYNSLNPTNNPGGYDLYVQLVINGKTNLVCNWSKQAQINNPNYP